MIPALAPGDHVLVDPRAYSGRSPREGEVLVARDPREPERVIVKRVASSEKGGILLCSDNAEEGVGSAELGLVPAELILGRVVARVR